MSRHIWRNFIAVALIAVVLTVPSTVVMADGRTAMDYMAEGIRAAYDNMNLIYQGFYDDEGYFEVQPAGHVAIWQEWDAEGNLISRTYLGSDGEPVNRVDRYCKVDWSNGGLAFYNINGEDLTLDGINLATDIRVGKDGWSEWMIPRYDTKNSTFYIGYAELGEKQIGDTYTCTLEIEFRDVTATEGTEDQCFRFLAQGATDGQWTGANVWNSSLINLSEPIENGTKKCIASVELNEIGAISTRFELGFRCDYWASGEFRIRNVKVERGDMATEWSPAI